MLSCYDYSYNHTMQRLTLDPYMFEVLMRDLTGHDRQPAAFLVYAMLWWREVRGESPSVSLQQLADLTGLSKSGVQAALRTLMRRRLVRADRFTPTSVPEYTVLRPWAR
jgi:hypothetical protein